MTKRILALAISFLPGCPLTGSIFGAPEGEAVAVPEGVPPEPPPLVSFGPVVESHPAPLPISGGTLLVTRDGAIAIAADPDRDLIHLLDLDSLRSRSIALERSDEPGRSVEDAAGRVHVVLRGGGAIASFDPKRPEVIERRPVCTSPRGIAHDPATDLLHVACLSGQLVSLPASGGEPTRRIELLPDLRDVVVERDVIWVSRFRAAEILKVQPDGSHRRIAIPESQSALAPGVAWRMIADPRGGVLVLHQLATTAELPSPSEGGLAYGSPGGASGVVSAISHVEEEAVLLGILDASVLAVDLAIAADGRGFAVASPGNAERTSGVVVYQPADPGALYADQIGPTDDSETTAVAFTPDGRMIELLREPAALLIDWRERHRLGPDGAEPRAHVGHALFHRDAGLGIACASCHPEGADDGRVWKFQKLGPRRTQNLRSSIRGTEPFHWNGELATFADLAEEVFVERMGGPELPIDAMQGFARWVESIPPWPTAEARDPLQLERGRALFTAADVGCASCHAGERTTNGTTVDVGTGGAFQVPSLIGVQHRAPYMHDGCAETLRARFDPSCGGGDRHGRTSHLDEEQLSDLIAYLGSL